MPLYEMTTNAFRPLSEASFAYQGYFAKTGTTFIHHPIPQSAWKQLLLSNAGEDVTVTLVFAKDGVAYGPIKRTWKIASAPPVSGSTLKRLGMKHWCT